MSNVFVFLMVAIIMAAAQFVFPIRNRETKQSLAIRATALFLSLTFLTLGLLEWYKLVN